MGTVPTIRVTSEAFPGGFVINEADFDDSIHTLAHAQAVEEALEVAETEEVDGGTEEANEGVGTDGLPDGYEIEVAGGPYYFLFGPNGASIEGPSNGKYQGRAAAEEAARAHAAG